MFLSSASARYILIYQRKTAAPSLLPIHDDVAAAAAAALGADATHMPRALPTPTLQANQPPATVVVVAAIPIIGGIEAATMPVPPIAALCIKANIPPADLLAKIPPCVACQTAAKVWATGPLGAKPKAHKTPLPT